MSRYAVNGKIPAAAWIPSYDPGSASTLTDLIGSNSGTLTDFALTGSSSNWVSDTERGGIRALDFDGTNDRVIVGNVLNSVFAGASAKFTIAAWVKPVGSGSYSVLVKNADSNFGENQRQFSLRIQNNKITFVWFGTLAVIDLGSYRYTESTFSVPSGEWSLVGVTFDATEPSAANKVTMFLNDSLSPQTLLASGNSPAAPVSIQSGTARLCIGAGVGSSGTLAFQTYAGRIDGVFVFPEVLTESDFAWLWNDGDGRRRFRALRRRESQGALAL